MKLDKWQTLVWCAAQVVNDFDDYGEVLQTDDDGEYGKEAAIEQLRTAIRKCKRGVVPPRQAQKQEDG